jgi:hypothetical protein
LPKAQLQIPLRSYEMATLFAGSDRRAVTAAMSGATAYKPVVTQAVDNSVVNLTTTSSVGDD